MSTPEKPTTEKPDMVGAQVYLEAAPGLQVLCLVTHAKTSYGRTRLQIIPFKGKGAAWVNASSVVEAEPGPDTRKGGD
jgi:hypothetical protein